MLCNFGFVRWLYTRNSLLKILREHEIRIDQLNQHTGLYPRIGMANENGQFTIVQESRRIVDPDPYMTNQIQGDWVTKLTTVGYPYAPSR